MNLIPHQYIFVFGLRSRSEPFHLCHYLCIESCIQINRPERILFYYHHEPTGPYWEMVKLRLERIKVNPVPFVRNFKYGTKNRGCEPYRYAHHSDFIRLEKLLDVGGIYADIDTLFVNPLPLDLRHHSFVLGREPDVKCPTTGELRPSLCNAVIMSEAGAPFGRLWLARLQETFDGTWSKHSTLLPQKLSAQYPELIHIEPQRSFYKHSWSPEGIRVLLQGLDSDYDAVYSFHLWSHLWWAKERTDFSDFHAGQLTEDYIRTVDTTYNVVARRFLR